MCQLSPMRHINDLQVRHLDHYGACIPCPLYSVSALCEEVPVLVQEVFVKKSCSKLIQNLMTML